MVKDFRLLALGLYLLLPFPHGSFLKLAVPFWGSHNKDYGILGFILGSPFFGKLSPIKQIRSTWLTLRVLHNGRLPDPGMDMYGLGSKL